MSYHVKLDQFEGPLDLLLHLISKAKVRIEDVSISEITQQYIETINMMQDFDIEIASEFLLMAATLLHIKSSTLVPKAKPETEEDDEADPKEELINKLLEYKKYKEISNILLQRESYYSGIFSKLPEEFYKDESVTTLPLDATLETLQSFLLELLKNKRTYERIPLVHEVKRDPVTITERIEFLKDLFVTRAETSFFKLFEDNNSKEEIIITFLALLELLKDNYVEIFQNYPFEDISIKRRVVNG